MLHTGAYSVIRSKPIVVTEAQWVNAMRSQVREENHSTPVLGHIRVHLEMK